MSVFDFIGLSEVSNAYIPPPDLFTPLDPESLLLSQNIISPYTFENIFADRIINCEYIANKHNKRLFIREHSHSYFFKDTRPRKINSVSWIYDLYKKRFGLSLPVLLSVRDPIDSWLSLNSSFENESPFNFDQYCEKYLFFLDMVTKTEGIYLFKYEDFVTDQINILNNIGKKIGKKPFTMNGDFLHNSVTSSGNSGRGGTMITPRKRRLFTRTLVQDTRDSNNYKLLCDKLGYPSLVDCLEWSDQLKMIQASLNNLFFQILRFFNKPVSFLRHRVKYVKN